MWSQFYFDLAANCAIPKGDKETTFTMTDAKPYVPVVTLSTKDNRKLLQQFKSEFRGTIN